MDKGLHDDLRPMGKVIRPHGLKGLLKIVSYARSEQTFLRSGFVFLKSGSGEIEQFKVSSVRAHKNNVILGLDGLRALEDAERYRGAEIHISKDALGHEHEEEGEYYWFELIGLKVYLNTGSFIGTIQAVLPAGSNDIYVVREGEREILVPATHEVIEEIDLEGKKMVIFPMEGLLEMNEV